MSNDVQDAARYRVLRAYAQAVRDWFDAHPDRKAGDVRPWFDNSVVIALSGDDLDKVCDQRILEGFMPTKEMEYES